ncbi:MAG: restriction endonuclease [Prolixibacteraceae bacterium]|nr:restriction endonuclease [Prolixibacteraceae bacterium]
MEKEILIQEQQWQKRKEAFLAQKNNHNQAVNDLKSQYYSNDYLAIAKVSEMVLTNSSYPFAFEKEIITEYNPENRLLLVEYRLPAPADMPTLKEIKYIATSAEVRESHISEIQLRKLYDETIYKITLRSIHELFSTDSIHAIDAVSFNGWVRAINKATGNEEVTCIVSIQVKKEDFARINLANVDPKACFKSFKGVGSSDLSGLSAIQPILQNRQKDKRFVDSHSVEFDDTTNLAAMAWEDFEHLIRELFEKEFSSNGGEVKVTQASRDGGVDAVAFDPDPIRGGKIVIQAKRYTNTVGVSAVRDLFGTVMNEGANKGILVTTSDYGSDSYEFAKGKPITLLNGANLLYLLEKHGTRAKIDIKEARRLMNEGG